MKPVIWAYRDDVGLVESVAAQYPEIAPFKEQIRAAYGQYIESRCNSLAPIALDDAARRGLRTAYGSESKRAGLDWISRVRNDHDHNYCPVCGGAGARTVEHHLPQAHFPEFCVYSRNLVPCCHACNTKRGDVNGPGADWTLHPYFDHAVLGSPLVYVSVQGPWEVPLFRLKVIESLNEDVFLKVENHLEKSLDLGLFGSWVRGEWTDLRLVKAPQYRDASSFKQGLRSELNAEAQRNWNSWGAALIRGVLRVDGLADWIFDNRSDPPLLTDAALGL